MNKLMIVLASLALVAGSGLAAAAVEFVELTDANQAILNLDLSKALKSVQEALQTNYHFETVAEAVDFLQKCKFLRATMESAKDDDYQGLAGKIKAILAEESLVGVCKVGVDKVSAFASLDSKLEEFAYIQKKKLNDLRELKAKLDRHPHEKMLLGYTLSRVTGQLTEKLLAGAAEDSAVYFDEQLPQGAFEFSSHYKRGCAISALKPICQLVRRTNQQEVSAVGADFKDFTQVTLKDADKVKAHEEASGVTLDTLKAACKSALKDLRPFEMVDLYKKSGFLTEERINEASRRQPDFDLFYQMYELCVVAQ